MGPTPQSPNEITELEYARLCGVVRWTPVREFDNRFTMYLYVNGWTQSPIPTIAFSLAERSAAERLVERLRKGRVTDACTRFASDGTGTLNYAYADDRTARTAAEEIEDIAPSLDLVREAQSDGPAIPLSIKCDLEDREAVKTLGTPQHGEPKDRDR